MSKADANNDPVGDLLDVTAIEVNRRIRRMNEEMLNMTQFYVHDLFKKLREDFKWNEAEHERAMRIQNDVLREVARPRPMIEMAE